MRPIRSGAAVAAVVLSAVSMAPAAAAAQPHTAAVPRALLSSGVIDGLATGDFIYLNALQNTRANNSLAQVSVSQSAAAVSSQKLTTSDSLSQKLFAGTTSGKNAYGHAAGVSLNLGQGANTTPQAQLTIADAASPPRTTKSTNIVSVPGAPVVTATVQPDTAEANTRSQNDFCVLGKPLSQGTADVAEAQLFPASQVGPGFALVDLPGEVVQQSTQQLVPNGKIGSFGLSSSTSLQTAELTLFKGVTGAETTIKVVNPVTLEAVAGGLPGTAKVTFGDAKGNTPVISVTNQGSTQLLTLQQLIGNGVKIDFDGLLKVHIGLKPTLKEAADGTLAIGVADLVTINFIDTPAPSTGTVGGPLGGVLNPILQQVFGALDNAPLQQIDQALRDAGLTKGADFRIGHFEASAQVPDGGVTCGLPVKKTSDKSVVHPGDHFTYTITVTNPYDCTLQHVKVDDAIEVTSGVLFHVVSTTPTADTVTDKRLLWNDIGTIKTGDSASVSAEISIDSGSKSGTFTDTAVATASCGTGGANGGQVVLTGQDLIHLPRVQAGPPAPPLPNTGMPAGVAALAGLLVLAGLGGLRWARGR